jgi:diphthamide synthase (EF-2-diphthine--ammonia ligase)
MGLRAGLTCVDPRQLDKRFVGRQYDEQFLAELPAGVDPCGERGEFHMFGYGCPALGSEIAVSVGDIVEREGFWFADRCHHSRLGDSFPSEIINRLQA